MFFVYYKAVNESEWTSYIGTYTASQAATYEKYLKGKEFITKVQFEN